MYMVRRFAERYPGVLERKIREAIPQQFRATRSEEELAAWSKDTLHLMLQDRRRRFQNGASSPQF